MVNHYGFPHASGTHENNGPAHLSFLDQWKKQVEIGTPLHVSKDCANRVIALPPGVFGLDALDDFCR
jgi:hypothetical protein